MDLLCVIPRQKQAELNHSKTEHSLAYIYILFVKQDKKDS